MDIRVPGALDELMPTWSWRQRQTVIVPSPPDAVFDAVGSVTVAELPSPYAERRATPVFTDLLGQGFRLFAEEAPHRYLLARLGRFWSRYEGNLAPDAARTHPQWFREFDQPGFAKAAIEITCTPVGEETLLALETRVDATDSDTRNQFSRHWLVGRWARQIRQGQLLDAVRARLAAER